MQRIVEFTDGNGMYAVPENDVKNFLAEDPNATRVRRFVGKDGSSYAVPENDVKDFLAEDSDVEEVFPVRTADGKDHFIPQSASKGRITKYNRGAFANDDAMGGMRLGALEAQAEGGVDAAEDDGSIGSWFKNLWNTFSHAAGGKMVSSDMEAKTHQVMNDAYKGRDGKDHSFEDLPDSVLDEYMNTIAPNGYWSYLGNAIGLGGKNRLMAQWDRDVGSKIEDPTERKKARVAYAREFAQIGFENTERRKDRARAEIEGREKAFGAGAVAGATQIAGYALPMAAPGGVGIALSAGIEGATRRNELLQDRHETTESGEIIRTAKGDTRNAALGKGAVGGAATALIEKYGGKLAGKALGKVAGKIPGADKIAETKAGKFLSRTGKFIDRYFGWTGQQSAPEEYAEEFVQGLVDAAFGLDMRESEKEGTTALGRMADFTGEFFAPKNLADLGESMFLVQLLGGTVGHIKNRSDSKMADRVLQNLGYDISAAKDFTADEKWRAIDAHYRGMSSDQVNEIFDKGAKAMDGLIKQFESENLATADGRAHIAAMHPEAVKKIVAARKEGKDVSRKMIRDAGLSEDVWKDVAARNDLGDSFIDDRKRTEELKRAKMDGYQANALAETISEFFGDSPEAQKVFDRIVSNLKDASVLDDPAVRENLVMEEGEKFWAEGREERIKAARERAKAAEKADHEARLAEAERTKKESYAKKVEARKTLNAEHDRIRRKMESGENLSLAEKQFMEQYAEVERMKASQTEGRLPAHIGAETTTAEAPAQTEESRRELKDGYEMRPVEGSKGNVAYRVYDKNGKWVGNVRKDGSRAVAVNKLRTKGVEEGEYAPWERGASAETEKIKTEAKNETRTDETQPKSEQAAQPGARKGKTARSVEAAPAPAEVGGAVETAQKPSTSAPTEAKANTPPTSAEGVEGASRATDAKAATLVKLADDTVPAWQKAVMDEKRLSADHEVLSDFANKIAESVKDKSESEISQIRRAFREALYAKGNPMPGGYKPLLDAAEYAFDVAIAKGKVKLPKGGHAANAAPQRTETAAKKSFEEKYREWAEEDAPAWAKDLSPEEKAEYERLLDDVLSPKEGKSDIERGKKAADVYNALMEFEKAHTPKRGRGRPKKVAAETKVETPKEETAAEPVAPNAEEEAPKSVKPDVDEVKKAMRALGALGGADISALEKALKEAEGGGLKERAKLIKTLLDYKQNLPKYGDARSDVSSGGRYRASIETAKPLDDPDFKAWAKKRGVVPTQQKREQYDEERVNAAKKALSRWIKGVKVVSDNAIGGTDAGGETRSAIKQEEYDAWNKILDDYEQGKILPGDQKTILPRTPSVLLKIGASNRPIAIHGGIIDKIVGKVLTKSGDHHEVPISELRNLQIELDNPIAVFRSKTDSNSLVVLTRIVDKNNNEKAVVALKLDAKAGRNHIVNSIASIHGRPTYQVNNWIGEGRLLYVNKEARKNTARWLQLPGDKVLRASGILTEKDFSDEGLGRIIPKSDADSNDIRYLHDGERIVGSYNRKTGEVTLAKGADIGTVVHELGWHAARHWAETAAAKGNRRAIALLAAMRRYAEEAPPEIKDAVLATYGEIDADALLDEIGAARFTAEKSPAIAKAIDSRAGAAWYKRIWNAVVDFIKDYLVSQNGNRVDLTGVENMSPQRFANFFATAMLSGKTLGENRNTMALEKSLLDAWTAKLSDYLDPVRKLSRRFYGTDGEAYRMGRIRKGTAQQGRNKAERAEKKIDKILVKNEISPELLDQYMQAMAYEERNAKIEKRNRKKDGSGMTQETADAVFEEIDKRGIRDKIQEAAQILWDLQDEGLQKRVEAGLISQETADRWRKEEPHHVPWRDAIDPESNEWMGRDYSKPDFMTAEGRTTSASGSPTTLMFQEFVNAFERAAENQFRQEIADMARMNDVIGTIYDAVQTDKRGNRSFIKYPQGGERAKVMSIPDGAKLESTSKGDGGLDNVLVFRENGETKYLVLNGDLGKAVAGAATGRTVAKTNKAVSVIMRGYSATATALSPTFAVRNLSADNLDVSGNLIKDYGYLVGGRLIKKTLVNEAKMAKDLLKYSHSGTFDGASKEFQDLVDRFETAGGLIGGATTEGYDGMQKRIAADFRAGRNRARTIGRNIVAGWLTLQKASELATRLAVFKALTEHGLSDKEAAMWSRESTVDFNKKGAWTPITNVLWMFSNSALGSSTRQLKGLFTTKNGIKFASGIAALGIAEGVLECAMNPEDDDDEGLGSGADMTEYERQNHFYIRFGNHVFKTKFHMGPFGYLKYLGNVAGRVMCGKMTAEKAAEELGSTALEVSAAFTGIGNVSMDAFAGTSVPTLLQPIVQGLTGVDYAGRPIYKKKFNEAKPDSSHGRSSTPGVYHWLAKKVNSLTGGGDYEKGGIDLTPETLELITEAVGKNFVRDVVNLAGLGWNAITGNVDLSETRNIPFVRDVHRKIDGNENRYYEALRRFEEDKYMLKDPNLKGEDRKKFFRERPWLRTNGAIGGTVVGSLKKKVDEWRRLEEKEGVSEEAKAKYKAFRRKAQARVIELMTPLEK